MNSLTLLDLFCGAGGAAMGYWQTKRFRNIVGVDIEPQPNYPFSFVKEDAIEYVHQHWGEFDFIHASPPCQRFSVGSIGAGTAFDYPDLVTPIVKFLRSKRCLYVVENVRRAPIRHDLFLCGTMFPKELRVIRHRFFELSHPVNPPTLCNHTGTVRDGTYVTVAGHGGDGSNRYEDWCEAMNIFWMTKKELAQAVPPAYTRWIGRKILENLIA